MSTPTISPMSVTILEVESMSTFIRSARTAGYAGEIAQCFYEELPVLARFTDSLGVCVSLVRVSGKSPVITTTVAGKGI